MPLQSRWPLLVLALCSAWTSFRSASAATIYYVNDGMGGNEVWCSVLGADTPANAALNFPTTAPAATIDYVIAQKALGPGDEIRVDAGSYDVGAAITFTNTDDGDATGNVTVRGALNGSARLAAIHDDNNTKTERVFYLNGSNYVVLRDLEIRKGANLGGGTEGYGVQVSDATNFQAINCWIHDNASYGIVISKTTVGGVVASHVVDSCQINANGGTGLQVARQTGCTFTGNRVFSNAGNGMQLYDDCSDNQVFDNVFYSNTGGIGVHYTEDSGVSQSGGAFFRNRVYGHQQEVRFTNTDGVTVRNNTLYHVTAGASNTGFLFEGDNSSSGWTLRNNIVVDTVASSPCVTVLGGSETGSNSRYNDFYPTGTALVGSYLGSNASTLATWFSLSGWDNPSGVSLSKDPGFVDFNGVDETLGGAGGLDDDFHLLSTFGYYTNSGGPFFDRNSDSPAIDAADPADAVGSETADHGGRMNQGAYGGTATAARSGDSTYTHTWTGWSILHDDAVNYTASADWNNANNWSGRTVPPATANVLIPDRSGVDEDPNTGGTQAPSAAQPNADTSVNGVYISDTASVYPAAGAVATLQMANATGYTLTASGAAALAAGQTDPIEVTSTGRIVLRTGALAVTTGDLRIDAGGLLTADTAGANGAVTATLDCAGTLSVTTAGGTMGLQNHATISGTITGAAGTTVQFTGSQATQTLSHTGGGSFAGLVVNKASGTVDVATSLTASEGLTVTSGTLRLGATGTVLILQAPSSVGAAGVFSMEGTTTVRFNQAAPSATTPQLLVAGTFRTTGTTGSFPVLTRDLDGGGEGNDTNSVTISITGTADINGLTLRRLGTIAGPPTVDGLQIAAGATVTNVNDIAVVSSAVGVNWLKTSGVFTMRGCSFDASPAWNLQVPTGVGGGSDLRVTLENASGAKGDSPNGEGNDLDPYDATVNPPDGRIVWVYFNWKWLGGSGTNQWDEPVQADDVANWLWQGTGPRPSDFPNGTEESVWIQSPTNPCTENGSFSIKDISITTGATLNEGGGGAFTLTIYGTAFKSSGGTFNAGDGTVTFAGSTTQTVIIIGGSGGFYDLTIAKTAGTTAELGTNLTVARDATVTSGDFDLENYTLTVQGNVTVAAGSTLVVGGTSRLYMNDGAAAKTLTVNGTLEVSSTGVVDLGDSGAGGVTLTVGGASGARRLRLLNSAQLRSWDAGESITFGSGSTFEASGGPTVTRQAGGAGGYSFTMGLGATLEVTQLAFSYAGAAGLTVESGAVIGNLRNVAFSNVTGGGTRRHLGIGIPANLTLTGLSFDATFDNPPGTGNNVEALTGTNGFTITMSQWTQTGVADPNTRDLDASEDAANRATVTWARTLTWVGQWRRYRTLSGLAGATANQYVFVRLDAADGLPWTWLDDVNELRVAVQSTTGAAWQEVARNVPTFTPASSIEVHLKLPSDFSGAGGGVVRLYYDYGGSVPAAPALSDAESPKTILSDTFETDKLWTLGAAPANGQWARGAPTGENAFAPSADSTDAGTFAYVTGLATTLDGTATLTSPALATTNYYRVQATFKRWIFVGGAGDSGSITAASDGVTFSTTIESFPNGTDVRAWTAVVWNAPTGFENVAGPKIRFTAIEATSPTFCEAGLDDFACTAYRGDVLVTTVAAESDTTVGGAGVKGNWGDPFHWTAGTSPGQVGPPSSVDDIVVNGNGTYAPQLDGAATIGSLSLGATAASNLNLGGASNYNLTIGGSMTWGANGTIDAVGRTAGTLSLGQDLQANGGTWTMPASAPASPFLSIGRDLVSTGNVSWSGSTACDVQVVRNVTNTAAIRFPGIVRLVGTGAGFPTTTLTSISTAAFRRVEVNRAAGAGSGYTVTVNTGSTWLCESFQIDSGVVVVPSGATIEASDQADATFDTTGAAGLGWVRFSTGGSSPANRVLRLTGGTVKGSRVGTATPATDAASNNNGRLDLQGAGGTIETTGFLFKNNTDAANTSDVILAAGTVRVAGNWEVSTSSGTAPSFLATGGTIVFHGTGAQSVVHSPSGGTPTFYNVQVGEGTNGPNTLSLVNDITCVDLDVVEGIFAPGANRTVTKTAASTMEIQSGGTLRLASGALFKLAGGSTIDVHAGGTLSTTGTSASSRARIQNNGAGTIAIDLSGTMNVDYVTIANLAATGVVVDSTAVLMGWTGVRFASGAAGGLYLDLSGATSSTTLPATMSLCQFDAGPATNFKGAGATATHANVTLANWAGAIGGEPYETNDDLDLIDWGSGAAVVLRDDNPVNPDVALYATLQDAVNDATALNNVIEVRDNVIRDETLNLSALAFRIVIDGAVLRPPGASTAIVGSGNPALEVLRNVVLIRDAASATPLLQDVANVIHCDVLGPFTTANPLITVTGPATCLIENSIVGDPGSWQADGDNPITKVGALTVNHSFVDCGALYPGTNNSLANPQFTNWDPITGGSGLYDVHLKPGSPCVDYAPGPSIAVATDFDRGLDFNSTDQDPGGSNPRRPINARPDAVDGGGPYASWNDDFGTYDVGADELGPLVVGTGNRAQGVPLWTNRAGAGVVADPDSFSVPITSFTFSPAVMFVAENNNVAQAGHDVRLVAYSMNDADSDGDLDAIESLNLTVAAPTIQKVHSITVIGGGSQDNLYLVVDRDADADTTADAVLAIRYNPTLSPMLAVRGDWTANPAVPAGSGAVGRIVIGQSDGRLYFPRGDGRIYRRESTDGTAPAGAGNWLGDGRLDLSGLGYDGKIDAEASLFAGKFNNSLYVPTNQHANEIIRVQLTDGSVPFAKSCGTGNRNHFGFNVISQSVFVTGADQYVWRIHEDTLAFNAWPAAVWPWQSEPMGATVKTTTRAQMFRTVDANVRVGAGSSIYKFRKDTGVMTDDSDGAGDDWGPGRTFRGNLLTAPTLIGGTGKDYTPVADGRRCGKLVFGTDQGYCYVASYIRATLASDAEDVADATMESQPASAAIVGYDIRDGRPYPGFPYRIPGVKIVNISLLTSSTVGRQVIVFITDNGWAYGFIEPY